MRVEGFVKASLETKSGTSSKSWLEGQLKAKAVQSLERRSKGLDMSLGMRGLGKLLVW
jgi:hypothetical protein